MKSYQKVLLMLVSALALPIAAVAQQTVYVKPSEASLRSGSGFGGPVVATVKQGQSLTVLQEERLRLYVRTSTGQEGYIVANQVQTSAPKSSSGGGLGGFVNDDRELTQMRTQGVNRGLLSEDAKEMAASGEVSEQAVKDLEDTQKLTNTITDSEVDSFMKSGGLNS